MAGRPIGCPTRGLLEALRRRVDGEFPAPRRCPPQLDRLRREEREALLALGRAQLEEKELAERLATEREVREREARRRREADEVERAEQRRQLSQHIAEEEALVAEGSSALKGMYNE